ncbi:MAG TPA: CDP-diacylglycerol--glycerol-3-phosphate 3-phosphatidyltransferase [Syntrophorhabdales bacterium]|nr:CDP-diacylglycerol--glycerol-3-phosphate 3-phosphatidyltransferase [Syntrophorhabdales bacterium]
MNLPNVLSILRLCLTAFFIVSVTYQRYTEALVLFVAQAVSDLLDGFLARILHKKTDLGAWLDPIADKVMLVSSYLVLGFQEIVPYWVVAIVLSRDLVVAGGFLFLHLFSSRVVPSPSLLGKATTVLQMVTVLYLLWSVTREFQLYFFYAVAGLTLLSGFQYLLLGLTALSRKEIV